MGRNVFGHSGTVRVMSENVQSKNPKKTNAEGFGRFLPLYAL